MNQFSQQPSNHSQEKESILPKFGDRKVINGVTCEYVDTGYTLRQYYSHLTPEKGPGPGWDTIEILLDAEKAVGRFGRTFTKDEVFGFNGKSLPDLPFGRWIPTENSITEQS